MIMTMIVVNLHEVKAKLSEYLEAVAGGERVLICKRNRPIAELRAIEARPAEPRPIGLAKGLATVPSSFFEALPDSLLDAFEAGSDDGLHAATGERHTRVAERPATYRARRARKRAR